MLYYYVKSRGGFHSGRPGADRRAAAAAGQPWAPGTLPDLRPATPCRCPALQDGIQRPQPGEIAHLLHMDMAAHKEKTADFNAKWKVKTAPLLSFNSRLSSAGRGGKIIVVPRANFEVVAYLIPRFGIPKSRVAKDAVSVTLLRLRKRGIGRWRRMILLHTLFSGTTRVTCAMFWRNPSNSCALTAAVFTLLYIIHPQRALCFASIGLAVVSLLKAVEKAREGDSGWLERGLTSANASLIAGWVTQVDGKADISSLLPSQIAAFAVSLYQLVAWWTSRQAGIHVDFPVAVILFTVVVASVTSMKSTLYAADNAFRASSALADKVYVNRKR